MKKQIIIFLVLCMSSVSIMAQISMGDIQFIQDYFGVEKTILINEYMELSPEQELLFWPIYNDYEQARLEIGKRKFTIVDEYINNVADLTEEKASDLVKKSCSLEIEFKKLQKKYFKIFSKKIGPVKAAQFYQFENYLNNVINISTQQSIPFVGELEQKHSGIPKK